MHANTQLPVLQGAHSRFEATGDATFRKLASFFVSLLLRTRTFATGGSSMGEYWGGANRLGEFVAAGEGTTQESCSTHNMMRLTRSLLMTAPTDTEACLLAEYHERALFNSVLGTQRGDRPGEMLYWLPLGAGVSKADRVHPKHHDGQQHGWSLPHGDFWCCVGSGLEAFTRLADATFFRLRPSSDDDTSSDDDAPPTLYVMQPLVPSSLLWSAASLHVTLRADEPGSVAASEPLRIQLDVAPLDAASSGGVLGGVACTVRLRLPSWPFNASRDDTPPPRALLVTAAGSSVEVRPDATSNGRYLEVSRAWRAGDRLALSVSQLLHTEPLADSRPRFRQLRALFCGPLLLAGLTYGERILIADPDTPSRWLKPVPPSAASQLRSLLVVGGGGGVVSVGPKGLGVASGTLPPPKSHDAPDATWRLVCDPTTAESCGGSIALEHFAEPGAFLGVVEGAVTMDVVDEVYSVYFYVVPNAAAAPRECSMQREPWTDALNDSPFFSSASRSLARRLLASKGARWSGIKGMAFMAQGVLRTPWMQGTWGVLGDRPGVIFADFGGAQHELTFEKWPEFVSTRCSTDGQIVKGAVDEA